MAARESGSALQAQLLGWLGVFLEVVHYWTNRIVNWFRYRNKKRRVLMRKMQNALTYEEWIGLGERIDVMQGKDIWREEVQSDLFDTNLIQARLREFRTLKNAADPWRVMFAIRAGLIRNYAGIGHQKLYSVCHVGTKRLIEHYYNAMVTAMEHIAKVPDARLDLQSKLEFFGECRHSFGRTALIFNGGGTFGLMHIGVVKALYTIGMLPDIISGSSLGAIVAAFVCVRSDEELPKMFQRGAVNLQAFQKTGRSGSTWDAFKRRLQRLLEHGVLMDVKVLEDAVRDNVGDYTFEEAHVRSGRILNITVNSNSKYESPRLFNYLTTPNVLIRSAACASLAVPGLYQHVDILSKDPSGRIDTWHPPDMLWTSLDLENELPVKRLAELFNVNHIITAQVSPMLVPFLSSASPIESTSQGMGDHLRTLLLSEVRHRTNQLAHLGLLPRFMMGTVNTLAEINKGDINIVPAMSLVDYKHIISSPSEDVIQGAILKGERSSWPHVNLIYHRMCLEKKVDEIFKLLKEIQKEQRAEQTKLHSQLQQQQQYFQQHHNGANGGSVASGLGADVNDSFLVRRKSMN